MCKLLWLVTVVVVATVLQATAQDGLQFGSPSQSGCQMVYHTGYALCYDEAYEQARWVAWVLTRAEVESERASRENTDFKPDPAVFTGSATKDDYRNSGYDKGHLAPAADMRWSKTAMQDCFLLSNISPQLHEFNAGIWEDLERATREAAKRLGAVDVIAGPVLVPGLPTIGEDEVAVPRRFFKVLLDPDSTGYRAIGFLMPNATAAEIGGRPFTDFAVPVDSVEAVTGLDFLNALDDRTENAIERMVDVKWWFPGDQTPPKRKSRNR